MAFCLTSERSFHALPLSAGVSYLLKADPMYWNHLLITPVGLTGSTKLNTSVLLLAPVAMISTYPTPLNKQTAAHSGLSAQG